MTPRVLADFLLNLYPSFREQWAGSLFRDSGRFTVHGVCAEFSNYYAQLPCPSERVAAEALFAEVERVVSAPTTAESETANAWCTCLLENIADTAAGSESAKYMGPASSHFFRQWHG
jgi:hypothetical protein